MFYEVIPEQGTNILTYSSDQKLAVGQIVLIPIRDKTVVGIIYKKIAQPNFPVKPIKQILYSTPLPSHLLHVLDFLHNFYLIPYPTALSLLLPTGIAKKRRGTLILPSDINQAQNFGQIPLNQAQKNALKDLLEAPQATRLLHGVTGSGKTNIYLKMAEKALKSQKSAILLVPEIALTNQLVQVFQSYFGPRIILLHSKQTESERHKIWENLLRQNAFRAHPQDGEDAASDPKRNFSEQTPNVIIGPRSALFAPVNNLGLIIIDEEHESSYYQENSPKYSAIRVAGFIANNLKIPLILGSATPAITDYFVAQQKHSLVTLSQKAKSSAISPNIHIIDFKERQNFTKNRYFSNQLLESIQENLKQHRQTLIFHNRRGSSPLSICEACGNELLCPHCFLPLTLHADSYQLICHTCGFTTKLPQTCPNCGSPNILHKGFGTKLLEAELNKLFKNARIARFDADNKRSESLDFLYNQFKSGQIDILIGTQTVAKGLDLPNLATVGIIQADAGLSLPDFSAEERAFELLTQVLGRIGRGHLSQADAFIQTYQPDHPTLNFAIKDDYQGFANYLLKKRRTQQFPPYIYLAKLEVTMKTEKTVLQKIHAYHQQLSQLSQLLVSVPTPAFHEHTNRGYTWRLIIRAKSRITLINSLSSLKLDKTVHLTLDPPSLL